MKKPFGAAHVKLIESTEDEKSNRRTIKNTMGGDQETDS